MQTKINLFMSKKIKITLLFCFTIVYVFSQNLTLVKNNYSEYKIVIPINATKYEITAAKILQDYIKKITTCELPIVDESKKSVKFEIIIGLTNRTSRDILQTKKLSLKNDGYYLFTSNDKLLILGGNERGPIYGVTGFLEDYLNCRKLSPSIEIIPKLNTVSIPQIDDTQIPPAEIRIVNGEFVKDSMYAYFRKLVDIKDIWSDGKFNGYFVHTLPRIIPSERYFSSHPEYFALINGKRVPYGQYCLSNPDVLSIVIDDLKEQIKNHPGIKYWSVSQSDNYYHCECDNCKAIDQEEGSPSGLMIRFVNEVAKKFPDKIITTLAYQYTRKPPQITKPLDNVMITLCSIELNRSKPIETDPESSAFVKELSDWGKISNKIMLWDYVTQFSSSFGPFPLYNTLQPNIQFFTRNNVIAQFQQANTKHSENFSELKSYIISKLLWNPNENFNNLINDFLKSYYGKAAPYIRQYFDMLHNELEKANTKLDIYGNPVWLSQNILSENNMLKYNEIFDNAEKIVADAPEILGRVEVARLPLIFSTIEIAKTDLFGSRGWYKEVNGKFVKKSEMNNLLERFYSLCKRDSIKTLNEKGLTPEFYYQSTLRNIDVQVEGNLAFKKKVNCTPLPDPKYTGIGVQMLTNGVKGSEDYKVNWLGWEDNDVSITVDLGDVYNVHEVNISTLHLPDVWILHPVSIRCSISNDGKSFIQVDEQITGNDIKNKIDIKNYIFKFKNTKTKYIRFFITGTKNLPEWHAYKGNKSWIFVDEITIK